MRKALKIVLLAIACVILSISAIACGHEHTFNDTWSYSAEKHWRDASCGHEEKIDEADHDFNDGELNSDRSKIIYTCSMCEYQKEEPVNHKYGEGVLSTDKTKITYTCSECGEVREEAHNHLYGTWIVDIPASIIKEGGMHRNCLLSACGYVDEQVIERVNVESISVTTKPNKVSYKIGETFDKTGLVVTAKGIDASTADITSLVTIEDKALVFGLNELNITYEAQNGTFKTSVFVTLSGDTVAQARKDASVGDVLTVTAYYVGVSDEGPSASKEMLIKDIETDDVIAVRNVKYGNLNNGYGYRYGDLVQIKATVKEDADSGLATKRYLDFSTENATNIEETILSSGNKVEFTFDDAVELPNYKNWKTHLGKTSEVYKFVHITGVLYTCKYMGASDKVMDAVLTANTAAQTWNNLKVGGNQGRRVTLRNNIMSKNSGADWLDYFGGEYVYTNSSASYKGQGYMKEADLYALYTGGDSTSAQLVILNEDWFNEIPVKETTELTEQDKIREVALSYYHQHNQFQYDQKNSRRNVNATPEDATAKHQTYLDCSSFANAVIYESLGINIIPDEAINGTTIPNSYPQTGRIASYASENKGNPDVIKHFVRADYDTAQEKAVVAKQLDEALQVGDVLNYRKPGGAGHIMLYIGDGLWIHSQGRDYYYEAEIKKSDLKEGDTFTASQGHDWTWGYEGTEGTVGFLYTYDLLYDTNEDIERYLLGDKTKMESISLIRPLNRVGAKITDKTEIRMQYRGLDAEKTLDVGGNSSVQKGQELTYTITIKNHSLENYTGIEVKEVLDNNVTLVSAPAGYKFENGILTFNVDVPSYKVVTISFKVKVNANASAGTIIKSEQTTVAGIVQAKIVNSVAGLTTAELTAVADKAKEFATNAKTFTNAMDFVEELYSEAVGVILPDYTTVGSALDDILDTNADVLKDTEIAKLVAPGLYGGRSMSNAYVRDKEVIRMMEQYNLSIGDVIIAEFDVRKYVGGAWTMTGNIVYVIYVFVGEDTLVAYTNETNVSTTTDTCITLTMSGTKDDASHRLVTIFNYDRYAVIRPSMEENNNI